MTRRIVLGLMLVVAMGMTSVAHAEEKGEKPEGKRPAASALPPGFERLDLTKDQKDQIKVILDEAREKVKAARENKDKEAGMKLREEIHGKLVAVLTDEQKAKLEKMRAERGEKGGDKGGDKGGEKGPPRKGPPGKGGPDKGAPK